MPFSRAAWQVSLLFPCQLSFRHILAARGASSGFFAEPLGFWGLDYALSSEPAISRASVGAALGKCCVWFQTSHHGASFGGGAENNGSVPDSVICRTPHSPR
jgi:hypothetical protein